MTAGGPSSLVQAVLTEHRHKSPRVQARLVMEALAAKDGAPVTVLPTDRPDPAPWVDFNERMTTQQQRLVDEGFATTRNRTHAAITALDLDPAEVRALVVEHDFIRVFRWTDRSASQTLPIIEEPA